jgi:hypothetical protein
VKRWQNGDVCLRWTAAGMLEAEQQFRKIVGYADLAKLAVAASATSLPTVRTPTRHRPPNAPLRSSPSDHQPRTVTAKFHSARGMVRWRLWVRLRRVDLVA